VKEPNADVDLIAAARRGATKAITLLEADEADLLRRTTDADGLAKVRSALQATKAVRAALFSTPEPTNRP
jgi:hypothetical protein